MTTPDKPDQPERTTVLAQDTPGTDEDTTTVTPPPWQRVTADSQPEVGQDTTQSLPRNIANGTTGTNGNGAAPADPAPTPSWPTETDTVTVKRPVVSGSAAPRLFGGTPPPTNDLQDSGVRSSFGSGALAGLATQAGGAPSALRRPGRGPRRANLQVKRFDPWSVLKLSLVLGVALFFVWLVAVGALYAVLDSMGVWDKVNGISSELLNANTAAGGEPLISAGRVFGIAAIIGAINIVLFSALATVGAFVYNVSADLAGGLEVTLAERE